VRSKLAKHEGERLSIWAKVDRLGTTMSGNPTVLLKKVKLGNSSGECLADHVWLKVTRRWANAGLVPGDKVTFTGVPVRYQRAEEEDDYTFREIRNISKAYEIWGVWAWCYMGDFKTERFEGPDAELKAKARAKQLRDNGLEAKASRWSEELVIK
jgi:hypothetical protein